MSAPEGSHPDARAADPAEMPLTLLGGDAGSACGVDGCVLPASGPGRETPGEVREDAA